MLRIMNEQEVKDTQERINYLYQSQWLVDNLTAILMDGTRGTLGLNEKEARAKAHAVLGWAEFQETFVKTDALSSDLVDLSDRLTASIAQQDQTRTLCEPFTDKRDSHVAMVADVISQLRAVDEVLSRRLALDKYPNRVEKIVKMIAFCARADQAGLKP